MGHVFVLSFATMTYTGYLSEVYCIQFTIIYYLRRKATHSGIRDNKMLSAHYILSNYCGVVF